MFDVFPGRLKLLYIDSCIFPIFSTSKVTLPGIEEAWTGLRMVEDGLSCSFRLEWGVLSRHFPQMICIQELLHPKANLKFGLAYVIQYDICC